MVTKTIVLVLTCLLPCVVYATNFTEALNDIISDAKIRKNVYGLYKERFKQGLTRVPYDTDSIKKYICPHKKQFSSEYMFLIGLLIKKLNNKFEQISFDHMTQLFEQIINDTHVVKKLNAFVHGIYVELWNDYNNRTGVKKLIPIIVVEFFDEETAQRYLIPCVMVAS